MTTAGGRASAATPPRAGVQPLASPKENVVLVINTSTGICIAKILSKGSKQRDPKAARAPQARGRDTTESDNRRNDMQVDLELSSESAAP